MDKPIRRLLEQNGFSIADYDSATGYHKEMQTIEHEFIDDNGNKHCLVFSTHGAQLTHYSIELTNGETVEVLYPPNPPGSIFQLGDVLRGGNKLGFPYNCEDDNNADGVFHGWAGRLNWELISAEQNADGTYTIQFGITQNQIPKGMYGNESITTVTYVVGPNGFSKYIDIQNIGTDEIYLNPVFHPYLFIDSHKNPLMGSQVGDESIELKMDDLPSFFTSIISLFKKGSDSYKFLMSVKQDIANRKTVYEQIRIFFRFLKNGFFLKYSDLVEELLNEELVVLGMYFKRGDIHQQLDGGFSFDRSTFGFWSESPFKFFCPELFTTEDGTFDIENNASRYIKVDPGSEKRVSAHYNLDFSTE